MPHDLETAKPRQRLTTGALQFGSRPARILVVSDVHSARTIARRLEGLGAQVAAASAAADLVATAKAQAPDLVLLDLAMPGLDGIGAVRAFKRDPATHGIPIVALSASDDVERQAASLDEGAADCVKRPLSPTELTARIRAILRARGREDLLRRRISFLEELAASDPLTSLFNRRAFDDRLHLEMERAARGDQPLSCLVIDIDWFKGINDRYGHQAGDDVLRQVAKIMLEGRGERDAQCRYGGEEFVWLLPGTDREYAVQRGEWLRRAIEETEIPTAEGTFRVTISVGASTYQFRNHGRLSAASLLDCADAALLDAKKQGKNRVVFHEPMAESLGGTEDAGAADSEGDAAEQAVFRPRRLQSRPHRVALQALIDASESPETDARAQRELRTLLLGSIKVLTEVLAARDREIMTHCHRVASTAVAIAMELELPPEEIERIKLASMIHDIGKLAIPEVILRKPSPLSPAEWELVRKHPERGAAMLAEAGPFSHLADLVLYHQEAYDGTGYPDGLAGSQIPLGARIIRVSDTFDALISDRPYRPRKSLEEAKAELRRMAGTTLDPGVVDALLRLLETMSPLERELIIRRDRDLLADPSPPGGTAPEPG